MNDNDPHLTPAQAKACTDILAAVRGLQNFQRISILTLVLAASIKDAAKNPESAVALVDLTSVQLGRHIRSAEPLEGLG
jgi:hypothetical protein